MDPNCADSKDESVDVSVMSAPVVGEKRKLPMGIHEKGKKLWITKRDLTTSKQTWHGFATLNEAEAAYATERALQAEYKRQKAARSQTEIYAENNATYGNCSKLERDVANAFCEMDKAIEVMNDSVLADLCGFFDPHDTTLALPIQLKTAGKPVKSHPNTWMFNAVRGYCGMVVVCWRVDKQDGWVFDGSDLDDRKSKTLLITPSGVNAKLALSGATPLGMRALIAFLRDHVATNPDRFPSQAKSFFSWQFGGKAHNNLKERIGVYLYQTHVDAASDFPKAQGGSYDLIAGDGKLRLQFKTGRVEKGSNGYKVGSNGYKVSLCESAGKVDGKPTYRPYPTGAFDELVVYYFDWKANVAHVWRIPASELVARGYLRTYTQDGKQCLYVYKSKKCKDRKGNVQWTVAYYQSTTQPLGPFPAEAEAAAGHLLDDFRSGRKS